MSISKNAFVLKSGIIGVLTLFCVVGLSAFGTGAPPVVDADPSAASVPNTPVTVSSYSGQLCLNLECDKHVLLTLRRANTPLLSGWQEATALQDVEGIAMEGNPLRVVELRLVLQS